MIVELLGAILFVGGLVTLFAGAIRSGPSGSSGGSDSLLIAGAVAIMIGAILFIAGVL
jgi:hypothetical protein